MRSYVVIGLGRFGSSVARELCLLGNEVLALDEDPANVQEIADHVTRAVVADGRDPAVLKALGVREMDCGIVAVGGDVGGNALIALSLKEMGVPQVVCKAQSHVHRRLLEKLGVDLVVFPEHETGVKLAQTLTHFNILNFIELSEDCGIVEVKTPRAWWGQTIREADVRNRYKVNIIAIRDATTGAVNVSHGADYILRETDVLLILGEDRSIDAIYKL